MSSLSSPLRRLGLALLVATVCAGQALATWSVVVINRVTGEVACASATCLGGKFPLKRWVPVIVVGRGAAAAQSAVDIQGKNRKLIWNGIHGGRSPEEILAILASSGSHHQSRQYGISTFDGSPVTFTGVSAGVAKHGVAGESGDLLYAIQGNLLTGDVVITEAEQALLNTPGDLGQKVMAAMEAARAMGGDGRCSCSQSDPPGCGAPPPSFTKSAHCSFIVLARIGDEDGICNSTKGCASGDYYLTLEVKGVDSDPDPIFVMQGLYDQWRLDRADEADALHSMVELDRDELVADGRSRATVDVVLKDIDGLPLSAGGHQVRVVWVGEGAPTAIPGPVEDLGGGAYTFSLTATDTPGRGAWRIHVERPGERAVLLHPPLSMSTAPLVDLHAGRHVLSASAGDALPFTINRGPAEAGRGYYLLGSATGIQPGIDFGGVTLPLRPDRFFDWTRTGPHPEFRGGIGVLDGEGRAQALLDLSPAGWTQLVGVRLHFCGLLLGPSYGVTELAAVDVVP